MIRIETFWPRNRNFPFFGQKFVELRAFRSATTKSKQESAIETEIMHQEGVVTLARGRW